MKRGAALGAAAALVACATPDAFIPQSQYPPDPYVKGYAAENDCIGGETLAARSLPLPVYPRRAFRTGRQGWVILKLDVAPDGTVAKVEAERGLPDGMFEGAARRAAREWRFEPPASGGLEDCRVLVRFRLGDVTLGG